jgi:hypothetical protein
MYVSQPMRIFMWILSLLCLARKEEGKYLVANATLFGYLFHIQITGKVQS